MVLMRRWLRRRRRRRRPPLGQASAFEDGRRRLRLQRVTVVLGQRHLEQRLRIAHKLVDISLS